jgi:hypothetical protein
MLRTKLNADKKSIMELDNMSYYQEMQKSFFKTYDFEHLEHKRASLACTNLDLASFTKRNVQSNIKTKKGDRNTETYYKKYAHSINDIAIIKERSYSKNKLNN